MMNEKQLIDGCLNNDRRAQKELYDLYSRKMMGICLRYVNEREIARDLLQEGFVKVFTSIHTYAGTGSLEGWMRMVFVNGALEYLRRTDILRDSAGIENFENHASMDESIVSDLAAESLMGLIQRLPTGFRTVFNLFAIEGYSHKEIAQKMGITESTSRSQYLRARQWLQEQVKQLGYES